MGILDTMIMILPTKEECLRILKESNVPDNIIAHCKAVGDFAMTVADKLESRGINVNRDLILAAALLHDIKKLSLNDHVIEGSEYIISLGFAEVANIIKKHGLAHLDNDDFKPKSWEEKAVFYADKRVKNDRVVSVEERFSYIRQRYKGAEIEREYRFTKDIENEILQEKNL